MPLRTARNLILIQERIKEVAGPRHYYTIRYHKEELMYCGQVPYWLTKHLDTYQNTGRMPRVLDIGAGYGTLASLASVYGAVVVTLDPVPAIPAEIIAEFGLVPITGDVEKDPLPLDRYDAIIMTEVLEHFNYHPVQTMQKVKDSLRAGGKIFLSTPDAASWGRVQIYPNLDAIPVYSEGIYNDTWRDEHIWQYSRAELESVMITSGLKITQLAHSNSPGGNHFNVVLEPI